MSAEQKSTTDEPTEQPSLMSPGRESDSADSSGSKNSGDQEVEKPNPERNVWRVDTKIPPPSLFVSEPGKISATQFRPHEERVWPGYDKKKYQDGVREWGRKNFATKTTGIQPSATPS